MFTISAKIQIFITLLSFQRRLWKRGHAHYATVQQAARVTASQLHSKIFLLLVAWTLHTCSTWRKLKECSVDNFVQSTILPELSIFLEIIIILETHLNWARCFLTGRLTCKINHNLFVIGWTLWHTLMRSGRFTCFSHVFWCLCIDKLPWRAKASDCEIYEPRQSVP